MSKFKMNFNKISEENAKFASAANSIAAKEIEKKNLSISKKILEGKGIFAKIPLHQRKMVLGYSGLLSEISNIIKNPFNFEGESGNKLKRYQIRYAAVATAYEMFWQENSEPEESKSIIDYIIISGIELGGKIDKYLKLVNSEARIFYKILAGKELKNLFEEYRKVCHTYVTCYFKKMKEHSSSIYNNSEIEKLYGNDGRAGLDVDIDIFEYINHKYVDYIFDKKFYEKVLKLVDSIINLVESYKKISLEEVVIEE